MWVGAWRGLPIVAALVACGNGGGGGAEATDAGHDGSLPDAGRDAQPLTFDAAPDQCPTVCLGRDCDTPFDPAEATSLRLTKAGALELQEGAAEGELRHVFDQQCSGLSTVWHSVTISGDLDGVELDVRGGQSVEELDAAAWQSVASGDELPSLLNPGGCGTTLIEVRLVLRSGAGSSPRVDRLGACYRCTAILC